jgi:aminoglycoside 6'-N-acetyltransferase I
MNQAEPLGDPTPPPTRTGTATRVRVRIPGDDAEWLRLRAVLWPDLTALEHQIEMAGWLARPDTVVLVAPRADGTGLAGLAEVGARSLADGCETSPLAYLEGWYVDAGSRRHGIGAALIRAAETWARAQGFREFASDAELENVDSQRVHLSVGFREVGRSVLYLKALEADTMAPSQRLRPGSP